MVGARIGLAPRRDFAPVCLKLGRSLPAESCCLLYNHNNNNDKGRDGVVAALEDLKAGASIRGLVPDGLAKVVQVEWFGDQAVKVTFEDPSGAVRNRLVYRNEEPALEVAKAGRPWSFDGDGHLLRLVSESSRIWLVHLFDPHLAIHTSRAPTRWRSPSMAARLSM